MENKPQVQYEENTIDLGRLTSIAASHKKQIGSIIVGCTLLATGISFILPKQYESTTLVQTSSAGADFGEVAMVASMAGVNTGSSDTNIYMEMMKSRRVLEPIINEIEWDDEAEKPEAIDFAKKFLDIQNIQQTNLITVTAKGRTPEEAQKISQEVVDNFLLLQTDKNQQTQSLLVKFLENRIEEAKKDAEEARVKFASYQQKHKIYSPDEQAKAVVSKMNALDEAISNMQVQEKTNQAKLDAVNAKLDDISYSSKNYNINDNEVVLDLRKQIVAAQVNIVVLRERYTENHPYIISEKEKIEALQKKLASEVNAIVSSKYTTLNTTQANLVREQANAEVSVAIAKTSEAAIKQRREEEEKKLESFPEEVLEYMNLQRDTNIKEQIYTSLIKQAEDKKLKEAMESMDIQIIDKANLSDVDKPSFPKKKIAILIGMVIGVILSILYSGYVYKREL